VERAEFSRDDLVKRKDEGRGTSSVSNSPSPPFGGGEFKVPLHDAFTVEAEICDHLSEENEGDSWGERDGESKRTTRLHSYLFLLLLCLFHDWKSLPSSTLLVQQLEDHAANSTLQG